MKSHNHNGQEYLMVDLPDDYIYEETLNLSTDDEDSNIEWVCYQVPDGFGSKSNCVKLPPGQWQILFLASEAIPEQAAQVVERKLHSGKISFYYYKDYSGKVSESLDDFITDPIESLSSLLSSHGMQGETLFLKRVK